MGNFTKNLRRIEVAFSREALARVCAMGEDDFADAYDLKRVAVDQPAPEDFYLYRDNGARVLAVAHLDTVGLAHQRGAHFLDTEAGPVVFSRALDDRLGAYIILELLPALGVEFDILLTVGEESGLSTASFFDTDKHYDYMIEFDRGGTDVVMYQYDDDDTRAAVRAAGARVGEGSFSDIAYLEHLGIKGFNWGVGYRDYHGPRAHAYLDDTFDMVARYLKFHRQNAGVHMPHEYVEPDPWFTRNRRGGDIGRHDLWDDDDLLLDPGDVDLDEPDWNEYPTLEELRRYEEQIDRESGRLDRDWVEGVMTDV